MDDDEGGLLRDELGWSNDEGRGGMHAYDDDSADEEGSISDEDGKMRSLFASNTPAIRGKQRAASTSSNNTRNTYLHGICICG